MKDQYGREIDYIRISVTDRCNFRCIYCMPPEGVPALRHEDILSYEELLRIVRVLARLGIKHIRLTGGEPLVRKGLTGFIRSVREIPGIETVAMTTNGYLLADQAEELKQSGLHRLNISLDTVQPDRFRKITGGGDVGPVLQGIEKALHLGFSAVRLNVVVSEYLTEEDLEYFAGLVRSHPLDVRFIEYMPIGNCGVKPGMTMEKLKERLGELLGPFSAEPNRRGNGPARYFTSGHKGRIGFIAPLTDHFCQECNRIRLTADGKIKVCLLVEKEFDIKSLLRGPCTDEELGRAFQSAVMDKPKGHTLQSASDEGTGKGRKMSQIGG